MTSALLLGTTLPGTAAESRVASDPIAGDAPPPTTIAILGNNTEALIGGDLTDPENDGREDAGPNDPTWNWVGIESYDEPGFGGGEYAYNVFDNKVGSSNDKWCCKDPTPQAPVWIAVQFAEPVSITHFTVTSGNDSPDRDPTNWQIQGSPDGSSYTPIYAYNSATSPWTERNQVLKFTLAQPSPSFRYIRYIAYETPGSLHQISEIEYFGTLGPQEGPPSIVSLSPDTTGFLWSGISLTSVARGAPPLVYQWLFNGVRLPDATNATLRIAELGPGHAGDYSVIVTNSLGSVASRVARLSVVSPTNAVYWTGRGDGMSWSQAANWSNNLAPTASQIAVIEGIGADRTILIDKDVTVKAVRCSGSLTVSGGNLTLTGENSQVAGDLKLAQGRALSVNGVGSRFLVAGKATSDGGILMANGGAVLTLPTLTRYANTNCSDSYLSARGAGSRLELPGVTNLLGVTQCGHVRVRVEALEGGRVQMTALQRVEPGKVSVLADGPGSVVDWSGVVELESGVSVEARRGGAVPLPRLAEASGASFTANGGSVLTLPALTRYENTNCFWTYLSAQGAGSRLELPGVTSFKGVTECGHVSVRVEALEGGRVQMTALQRVEPGKVSVLADGTNSVVDWSEMVELETGVSVEARNGGAVQLPRLAEARGASFTANGGSVLTLPALTRYENTNCFWTYLSAQGAGSRLELPGVTSFKGVTECGHVSVRVEALEGGRVQMTALQRVEPGNVSVLADGPGSVVDWSGVVELESGVSVEARRGGAVPLPRLAEASGVSFAVKGGSVLALPTLTRYANTNCSDSYLSATGPGSRLELPGVTTLLGVTRCGHQAVRVEAWEGGEVHMPALQRVEGGYVRVLADGPNSVVDWSGALELLGSVSVEARNAGSVYLPLLTEAHGVSFDLGARGVLDLAALRDVDGSSLSVSGGSVLSLPGIKSYTHTNCYDANLSARGAGSRLELPGVTNLLGVTRCGHQPVRVEAWEGGQVHMPALQQVGGGHVSVLADGNNSGVDWSAVRELLGSVSLAARNGGSVHLPLLTEAHGVSFDLGAGGVLDLAALRDVDGSSLSVSGGSVLSLPGIKSYTHTNCYDANLSARGAGSRLELPGVTNLLGVTRCGHQPVRVEAWKGGEVHMPALQRVEGGYVRVLADGPNSVVDWSGALELLGSVSVEARNAGNVYLPLLTEAHGVSFDLGARGVLDLAALRDVDGSSLSVSGGSVLSLPGIKSYTHTNCYDANLSARGAGSRLELPGVTNLLGVTRCGHQPVRVEAWEGGQVHMPALQQVGGGHVSVLADGNNSGVDWSAVRELLGSVSLAARNGGSVHLPLLTEAHGVSFDLGARGVLDLAALRDVDGSSLSVSGGSVLSLPGIKSYTHTNCYDANLSARGAGSRLELPGVTNLLGVTRCGHQPVRVEAWKGGEVHMPALQRVEGGYVRALADGPNSVVDWSGALELLGSVSVAARNGGAVLIPNVTALDGVEVELQGPDSIIPLAQVTSVDRTSLAAKEGAVMILSKLPQKVSISGPGSVLWADGEGSRIVLPTVTTLEVYSGFVWYDRYQIQATAGGKVELPAVAVLSNGIISVVSRGAGSVVDLSALTNYRPGAGAAEHYHYLWLDATDGGVIRISLMTELDHVHLTLRNAGPMPFAAIRAITRSTVLLDATRISMPNLVDTTGTTFRFENGGAVEPLPARSFPLQLNKLASSSIERPFAVDQWEFSALAGQSLTLDLVNATRPEIYFALRGPADWVGFQNTTNDFGPATLPLSGSYILEAAGRGYPVDYAFKLLETTQYDLEPGTNFTGQFVGSGQPMLFRVRLPSATPFFVRLNNGATSNRVELYARLGTPPTRGDFDMRSQGDPGPNQQLLVPTASKGTWYVLAYGETVFTPGEFTISVQAQEVILTDIAPRTHAMDAPITLTLTGAGFDRSTRVQLKGQSGTYPANEVEWDSATRITAKFAENTVPEGVYSVEVSKPQGSSSVLPGVLTLIRGKVARLETKLILPDAFGVGAPATIYVEYTNAGTIAMPAPVLMVQAINERQEEGAWLTLQSHRLVNGFWTSASPEGFSHSPQILASGKTPGVLQPGEAGRVPIYYVGWKRPWGFRESIWRVSPLTADLDFPINWNALKEPMRPPAMNPEAWDHLWPDFTAGIGVRWGDYVRMLGENADYLGRIDRRVDDVNELLAFELQQAEGLNPFGTLASAVDAQVRAPGMPISFSRSFAGNISGRFELGALGRGWAHNWQYSLEQAADGKVTVRGPHSSRRVFQPDSRRAGSFFSTPSDTGTLTNRNGAMEIYEASGVFTAFRPDGRLDYVQDPNGNRITANYTGSLLTSLTHSSGQQLELAYNAVGRVDRLTAYLAPGVAVYTNRLDYDSAGQHLTRAVYYDGRIASYGYELNSASPALHSLTNVTSACCDHRYFTYDSLGRLQSTSLTDGAERLTLSYGRAGQVTVTDALNNSTITLFDHRGRVARVENALGNTVQFTHDINGRLTKLNDPAGLPHQYGYGRSGNLERLVDPLGYTTRLGFGGPFNKMTELTDANSNPTRYRYDEKGNLRAIVYADDSVEGWTYDGYGNATTWTNRRGQTIQYRYDARGALTNKIHLDGRQEVYLHDHRGNLTNAASLDPAGLSLYTLKYAYNGADQLTNIAYPGGQWLAFTYTEAGRRATSLDQTGHLLAYSYDGAGRLEAMTNQLSEEVVRYTYDATGRMRHKQVGKTVSTTYDYDSAGQLLSLTNRNFSGTVLSFFNYAYDDRGRRYSMDTHFGKWTYRYDDLGQLTNAALFSTDPRVPRQNITYGYDALGNRLWTLENGIQRDYQPNRLNQYERVGHIQIYFDADGNTTNEVGGVDTVSYIMSDENRLLRVLRGRSVWDYTYDALGARVSTEENGTVTRYLVDPIGLGNLVGEYDGNGNILAAYDFGVGLLQKVQAERKGAIVYAFDAMGNAYDEVLGLASIRRQYAYEPFGPMDSSDAVDESRLSLGAEYGVIRGGSGLYFMRARCYVKELGRFITSDPIGARGGINLYGYAVNNPLSFIDPSGLSGEWHDDTSRPPNPNPRTPSGKHPFGEFLKMEQIFDDYNASRNTHLEKVSWEDWNNGVITEPGAVVKPWPKEFIPVSPEDFFGRKSLIPPDKALIPFPIPPRWCELHPVECKEYCTQCGCCDGQPRPMRGGFDPNAKSGPGGYGAAGHIAPGGIMPYRIDFENDKNATAPAQQVVITDKLSSSLDWTMFQLTEVGFGDLFIAIPSVSYFETNVVMNYLGMDFAVQIETGIRLQTGEVYAVFRSLNPDTGLPPPVDVGFLPPEDGTRRGMGHVSYTIRAKPNLPTGTEIRNIAMISFDNQEVIATNQRDPHDPSQGTDPAKEALNTIDVDVPSSAVLPLPTTAANHRFTVTWAGADRGAGVASYDIYASADNGPWSLWLSATTNSSGAFPGLPLTRYGFFSVARDGVGHTEPPRWAADTTTTTLGSYPPVIDPVPDLTIEVGQLLVVTNFAHDVDTNLVFTLGPGAPRGATLTPIGPETALFRWQPGCLQGNTTNRITVQVTDNGVVPESSSITFTVRVNECVKPDLGALVLREGQTGVLPLNLTATTNYARLLLGLPLPADRLAVSALEITNIAMICSNLLREAQGGYILELFACTNQWLYTSNRVERQGWLYLKATPGQSSAVVPLEFGPILGTMPGGAETSIDTLSVGRVVIVGEQPLLEAVWREGAVFLVLYAPPGTATRLESATALGDAADWQALQVVQPSSELQQTLGPIQATDSVRYFRARRE